MKEFGFTPAENVKNHGIAVEWGVCEYFNIERHVHDNARYDKDSDVNYMDMHISVKAEKFTLMAGGLCEGRTTFDGIWELYIERTHSNYAVYGTKDGRAFLMNMEEFKEFVYLFCSLGRESQKNGGACKIKCRSESKKMLQWLEEHAA